MNSPMQIATIRGKLFANGFRFVPLITNDKKTEKNKWSTTARELTSEQASLFPDTGYYNTGILCDGLQAVDIDTDDPILAAWIVEQAQQMLGPAPIRYRSDSVRRLLLYRAEDNHAKSLYVRDAHKLLVLEIIGFGRQIAAYGVHPDGAAYEWMTNSDPQGYDQSALPLVSNAKVDAFVECVRVRVAGTASRINRTDDSCPIVSMATPTEREMTYAKEALVRECRQLEELKTGRNVALNKAAFAMGTMSRWIDPSECAHAILNSAIRNGYVAKDGEHEAKSTIHSGITKGGKKHRAPLKDADLPAIDFSRITSPAQGSTAASEQPRPLRHVMQAGNPFPLDALGPLYWAAYGIMIKIQCPPAIAALSILGAAALAAQLHVDVVLPRTDHVRPVSLYLISIGESGERKSSADTEAMRAVSEYERGLKTRFDADYPAHRNARDAWESARQTILRDKSPQAQKENALNTLREPEAPLTPMMTCPEPTFEGLMNLFSHGHGGLGLFSDEGGQFVGGHAMRDDSKLMAGAGLSSAWDGKDIKRVRAQRDGSYSLTGRRLTMHLMLQPRIADGLFSDPILKDQGLLSRILVAYPQSTAGTRFNNEPNAHAQAALDGFAAVMLSILRFAPMTTPGKRNELTPRRLHFDAASHDLWCSFADKVEMQLSPAGKYQAIKGLANKLPEHAARIAGVMTLFENFYQQHIAAETLRKSIIIAEYFADEAIRMSEAAPVRGDIALAESLLEWLTQRWVEPFVSLRVIQHSGPNSTRDSLAAKRAIKELEEHGWLVKAPTASLVQGMPVRDAWQIFRN